MSTHKVTLNTKVKRLGLLPLHFASFNNAQDGVITVLFDFGGEAAIVKAVTVHLPIHLARHGIQIDISSTLMVKIFILISIKRMMENYHST